MAIFVHRFGNGKLQNWQYNSSGFSSSSEISFNFNNNIDVIGIGSHYDGANWGSNLWNGPLAEVALWDSAISNETIASAVAELRRKYSI